MPTAVTEGPIHMPNPSYYPLLCALGMFFVAFGILVANPHLQLGFFGVPILSALGFLVLRIWRDRRARSQRLILVSASWLEIVTVAPLGALACPMLTGGIDPLHAVGHG